jgi:hypothetical protein
MQQENQVLQSSPAKRSRAGLPPSSNRGRAPQHNMRQSMQREEIEPPMREPEPANYNFNEEMADPFGSKKAAVMNTPPGGVPAKANFQNE